MCFIVMIDLKLGIKILKIIWLKFEIEIKNIFIYKIKYSAEIY